MGQYADMDGKRPIPGAESARLQSDLATHLSAIDPFRGAAAMAVLLVHADRTIWRSQYVEAWNGHLSELLAQPPLQIVGYLLCGCGILGVHLFFVVSGFCIHLPFAGNKKPMPHFAWIVRRVLRLYPAYFVAFNLGFAIVAWQRGIGHAGATLPNYLGHLFFWHFQAGEDGSDLGIIIVLWTISIEMQLYLLYVGLLPLLRRFGVGRVTLAVLVFELAYRVWWESVDWSGWWSVALPLAPRRFVLARLGEWLLGAWVAEAWARGTAIRVRGAWTGALLLAAIGAVAISGVREWWLDVPVAVAFALWLSSRVADGRSVAGAPGMDRVLARVGEFSYSLYLTHTLVIASVFEMGARIAGIDKDALAGRPLALLLTLVACCIVVGFAYVFYLLIERPSHRAAKQVYQWLVRRPVPANALTVSTT
jgi:peptidoglycan/LPS O-acetylase OafA/YrhL